MLIFNGLSNFIEYDFKLNISIQFNMVGHKKKVLNEYKICRPIKRNNQWLIRISKITLRRTE